MPPVAVALQNLLHSLFLQIHRRRLSVGSPIGARHRGDEFQPTFRSEGFAEDLLDADVMN